MSRLLGLIISISIAILIVGSSHYYIWARVIRDARLPAPWGTVGTVAIVLLGMSVPAGMILSRFVGGTAGRVFGWLSFTWMGVFFFMLCLVAASDVLGLLAWGVLKVSTTLPPPDAGRRLFLSRVVAGGIGAIAGAAAITALRTVRQGPSIFHVPVSLPRFPESMNGFKIAQISDLHVASLLGRDYVEQVVSRTNAQKPDLIVVTGDLIDGSVEDLRESVAPLADLRAKYGVYFITGNHEYYSGADQWLAEVTRLGMHPLRNERVSIGEGAESFDLAGVDDLHGAAFGNGHGADMKKALRGRDERREVVLLAHQPKAVFEAAEHNVGLLLSGHTHGGQIWPFNYLVRLQQPYVQGWAQHGPTQVYVNRGTGFWGPPMRLGVPPELTILELRRA